LLLGLDIPLQGGIDIELSTERFQCPLVCQGLDLVPLLGARPSQILLILLQLHIQKLLLPRVCWIFLRMQKLIQRLHLKLRGQFRLFFTEA
jgi:hypothetical protein